MSEKHEIRSLTGLRGLAAVLVVMFHYSFIPFNGQYVPSLFGPCYLAVDLFFVLSGFVMAKTYGGAFRGAWSVHTLLSFLERRFARVYPLYFAATLAAFVLVKLGALPGPPHPTQALATNVLALQNLGPGLFKWDLGFSLDNPCWSISTEAGAYLLFPWLCTVMLFRSNQVMLTMVALALASLALIIAMPDAWKGGELRHGLLDVAAGTTLWPLLRCMAGFTLGLAAFRLSPMAFHRRPASLGWIDCIIVAVLLVAWFVPGADGLIVTLFPVLIWHVCTDASPLARLLGHPVPKMLGDLSYALYLIHFIVGPVLAPGLHATLLAAGAPYAWAISLVLVFGLSLVLSWLAFNFLEKPARDFLRVKLALRRSPMAGEPAAP